MNQIRYDGSVTIAVGESRRSTQWKNKEVLWSQLVERLSNLAFRCSTSD